MRKNQNIGRITSSMRSLCLLSAVAPILFFKPRLVTAWLENQFDYEGLPENLTPLNEDAVRLALTHEQGASGMRSKRLYGPYGTFTMMAKLMAGRSAGVCATFYLTSDIKKEHEFDFEFLGSPDANPEHMLIQTNYFNNANGGHEKRSKFHFDPSAAYHKYTIVWAPTHAEWFVDDQSYRRVERIDDFFEWGDEPLRVHASIWDASWWATGSAGHQMFVNYTYEPFQVEYGSFKYTPLWP